MREMTFEMKLHGPAKAIDSFEENFWEAEGDRDWYVETCDRRGQQRTFGGAVPWNIQEGLLDETSLLEALKKYGLIAEIWGVDRDDDGLDHYIIDKGRIVLEDTCIPAYSFMDPVKLEAVIGSEKVAEAETKDLAAKEIIGSRAYALEAKEVLGREYIVVADSLDNAKKLLLEACDAGLVSFEDGEVPSDRWEVEEGDPGIPCNRDVITLGDGMITLWNEEMRIGSAPSEELLDPSTKEGTVFRREGPMAALFMTKNPSLSDIAEQANVAVKEQENSTNNKERDAR